MAPPSPLVTLAALAPAGGSAVFLDQVVRDDRVRRVGHVGAIDVDRATVEVVHRRARQDVADDLVARDRRGGSVHGDAAADLRGATVLVYSCPVRDVKPFDPARAARRRGEIDHRAIRGRGRRAEVGPDARLGSTVEDGDRRSVRRDDGDVRREPETLVVGARRDLDGAARGLDVADRRLDLAVRIALGSGTGSGAGRDVHRCLSMGERRRGESGNSDGEGPTSQGGLEPHATLDRTAPRAFRQAPPAAALIRSRIGGFKRLYSRRGGRQIPVHQRGRRGRPTGSGRGQRPPVRGSPSRGVARRRL